MNELINTFGQTGSLIQDIVTATCLRDMSKKFLERYEFKVKHLKFTSYYNIIMYLAPSSFNMSTC